MKKCKICQGTGHEFDENIGEIVFCNHCNGSGDEPCFYCLGSGLDVDKLNRPCPVCTIK